MFFVLAMEPDRNDFLTHKIRMGVEMTYKISFIREQVEIEAAEGITLLEAEIQAGLCPDAPCGGQGKCGKCLVKANGEVVKACTTKVTGDVAVDTLIRKQKAAILTEGLSRPIPYRPGVHVQRIEMPKADPGDNRSDWARMIDLVGEACGETLPAMRPNLRLASSLYQRMQEGPVWYVIYTEDEILDLKADYPIMYMAAFDIGTTTVVGYLIDVADGQVKAIESMMNPQAQYGADVIMRANYALEHGGEVLSSCIRKAIDALLAKLAKDVKAEKEDIYQVSIVGNTCMHHLFLGINPGSLVHAPYNPAISERLTLKAAEYGLHIHPEAQLMMLPDIAGYVGADTCGCLLAIRQDLKEEMSLMIDIGTNGEMVMGNKDKMATCSTAAGPAFEGAKIECGMRGASGAVDHVAYKDGTWTYTTVNGKPAIGLCGSGLIDLVAELYRAGLIDEMGHLESGQENDSIFMLVPPEEAGNETGVYLTQKDVREVQLAKAAIAAGIQLLMQELGIEEEDLAHVYIAGAFGNYMNPSSAAAIGMIPLSLEARVVPVGNAAGEGAKIALLNREELALTDSLVKDITFLELAASPEFQDIFVDELAFPEEDED